jgi:hypothetical protein
MDLDCYKTMSEPLLLSWPDIVDPSLSWKSIPALGG